MQSRGMTDYYGTNYLTTRSYFQTIWQRSLLFMVIAVAILLIMGVFTVHPEEEWSLEEVPFENR